MKNQMRATVAGLVTLVFVCGVFVGTRWSSIDTRVEAVVGLNPAKSEIDTVSGGILRDIHTSLDRAKKFKFWLDSKSDADLIAMGYVQAEVDNMKSAYADADQLSTLYAGSATLGVAKDFRTFMRRLWGLGGVQ